jgi:putative PIN family toxin of toxin-antitoxin system
MTLAAPHRVVLDTNWVLDLFVFNDPATATLDGQLEAGQVAWLMCPPMLQELERVLGYPPLQKALARRGLAAQAVLQACEQRSLRVAVAEACGLRCTDPDDQTFIDLAVAHQATLLSKDQAVLHLARQMVLRGANAQRHWG